MGANGKVYLVPYYSGVVEIDPSDDSVQLLSSPGTVGALGCSSAQNGSTYTIPQNGLFVVKIFDEVDNVDKDFVLSRFNNKF